MDSHSLYLSYIPPTFLHTELFCTLRNLSLRWRLSSNQLWTVAPEFFRWQTYEPVKHKMCLPADLNTLSFFAISNQKHKPTSSKQWFSNYPVWKRPRCPMNLIPKTLKAVLTIPYKNFDGTIILVIFLLTHCNRKNMSIFDLQQTLAE